MNIATWHNNRNQLDKLIYLLKNIFLRLAEILPTELGHDSINTKN